MERGLRILGVSRNYPNSIRPYEGPWAYTQFKALAEAGGDVRVLAPRMVNLWTFRHASEISYFWKRPKEWTYRGLQTYGPKFVLWIAGKRLRHTYARRYYRGVVKTVDEIYREWPFDIIYTQSINPDAIAAIELAKRYGISASGCIIGEGEVTTGIADPALRDMTIRALNQLDLVVAESASVARTTMNLIGNSRPVYPILRGSFPEDLVILPEVRDHWRRVFNFPAEAVVVMYVGHLYAAKGVLDLIEAFRKIHTEVPYGRLVYVGGGDMEGELRARISRYGLSDRVRLTGPVPFEHVMSIRSLADFMCCPSHTEGLGLVNVEAGFCRKAVVGANTGGIPEVVCDGKTGLLFDPKNVADLAVKLKQLFENKDLRYPMGQAAFEFVSEHHDAHKNTRKLYHLLKETVLKRRGNLETQRDR